MQVLNNNKRGFKDPNTENKYWQSLLAIISVSFIFFGSNLQSELIYFILHCIVRLLFKKKESFRVKLDELNLNLRKMFSLMDSCKSEKKTEEGVAVFNELLKIFPSSLSICQPLNELIQNICGGVFELICTD